MNFHKTFLYISMVLLLSNCSIVPKFITEDPTIHTENTTHFVSSTGPMLYVSTGSSGSWENTKITNDTFLPHQKDSSPILINNLIENRVYLMNKTGEILYEWPLDKKKLGTDATILPDGKLLVSFKSTHPDNSKIFPGGVGGVIQLRWKNAEVFWESDMASDTYSQHHEVEMLPNGNILMLIWNKIAKNESRKHGYKMDVAIYPETIVEMDPKNNSIVWKWDSMDHIVQDIDPKLPTYGNVAKHPERIDINYSQSQSGMIMHANGLVYDQKTNLIYVSLYGMSEVWIIDHSTTTEEAKGSTGGKYKRWWDLVYRFGNPTTYRWFGKRILYAAHHPSFTESGTFLIYSNGVGAIPEQSTVYELRIPNLLGIQIDKTPVPRILWSYTNPDIYFDKVGWAVRLPNGNTLITEWDGTIWEITPEKKIAWKYSIKPSMLWRTYAYPIDSLAIRSLGIVDKNSK